METQFNFNGDPSNLNLDLLNSLTNNGELDLTQMSTEQLLDSNALTGMLKEGQPQYSDDGDHPNFEERVIVAKEWISAINPDEEEEFEPGDTKDKRGNYKCGRCGQPKKGHNCPNQPRPKNQNLQLAEGCCQAEIDTDMTMRYLPGEGSAQGFPTSYGLKSWYSSRTQSIPFPVNAIGALQALTNLGGVGGLSGGGGVGVGGSTPNVSAGGTEVGKSINLNQSSIQNQLQQLQQLQLLQQLQKNNNLEGNYNPGG